MNIATSPAAVVAGASPVASTVAEALGQPGATTAHSGLAADVAGHPSDDPIFALIAEHKATLEALAAANRVSGWTAPDAPGCDEAFAATDAAFEAEHRALSELLAREPTTIAGIAALLEHLGSRNWAPNETVLSGAMSAESEKPRAAAEALPAALGRTLRSLAGPGQSTPASSPDPIFAAIERHRQAHTATESFPLKRVEDDIPDTLLEGLEIAEGAIMATSPTTLQGVVALLRYNATLDVRLDLQYEDSIDSLIADAIEKIAA